MAVLLPIPHRTHEVIYAGAGLLHTAQRIVVHAAEVEAKAQVRSIDADCNWALTVDGLPQRVLISRWQQHVALELC